MAEVEPVKGPEEHDYDEKDQDAADLLAEQRAAPRPLDEDEPDDDDDLAVDPEAE
jgi:hypothetical protein